MFNSLAMDDSSYTVSFSFSNSMILVISLPKPLGFFRAFQMPLGFPLFSSICSQKRDHFDLLMILAVLHSVLECWFQSSCLFIFCARLSNLCLVFMLSWTSVVIQAGWIHLFTCFVFSGMWQLIYLAFFPMNQEPH